MSIPDLPLPTPGQMGWAAPLNESLELLNDALTEANDKLADLDGRLKGWSVEVDDEFVVRDMAERVALKVHRDGSTAIPRPVLAGAPVVPGVDGGFAIVDQQQRLAFRVNSDGSVQIPNLIGHGGGSNAVVRKVVLAVMMGQSNGEGRGRPTSPRLDPQDSRIRMYDWNSDQLVTATVPLSSPRAQIGLSPVTPVARRFVRESADTAVVVLNAAVGGSALAGSSSEGVWRVGYTGTAPALFSQTVATISRVRSLIEAEYGMEPEIWFYWHQGESDSGASQAQYAAALDDLIAGLRSAVGDAEVPFTIGGVVPERIVSNPGLANVRLAQIGAQVRNEFVAYTDGIPGGGGSGDPSDSTHYTRQGVLALGDAMFDASMRAATASADQVPHKPLHVDAALASGSLRVSWSEPDTRFTAFVVEYRVDGGAWVSRTVSPPETNTTITGVSGGPVEVRVTSRNGSVDSLPTIPVLAH